MENAVVESPSIPLKMGQKYIPAGFEMSISYYTTTIPMKLVCGLWLYRVMVHKSSFGTTSVAQWLSGSVAQNLRFGLRVMPAMTIDRRRLIDDSKSHFSVYIICIYIHIYICIPINVGWRVLTRRCSPSEPPWTAAIHSPAAPWRCARCSSWMRESALNLGWSINGLCHQISEVRSLEISKMDNQLICIENH